MMAEGADELGPACSILKLSLVSWVLSSLLLSSLSNQFRISVHRLVLPAFKVGLPSSVNPL